MRFSPSGKDSLVFIMNFTPVARGDYRVGVPCAGEYTLLLDEKMNSGQVFTAEKQECDGQPYSIPLPLPPYGTAVLKFDMKKAKKDVGKITEVKKKGTKFGTRTISDVEEENELDLNEDSLENLLKGDK